MTKTFYQTIVDALLEDMQSGTIATGEQIPTEQELSTRFGVSRITSARAVRELETLGMVKRVRGKGSFVTDESQWAMNKARSNLTALVVPFSRQNDSGYALLEGLEAQARAAGLLVTLHNSQETPEKEQQIIQDVMAHSALGAIIYPDTSLTNLTVFGQLVVDEFPFVIIDREVLGIEASFVGPDNRSGMRRIVEYLVSIGHRQISYMASTRTTLLSERARFLGYCDGLVGAGLRLREDHIYLADEMPPTTHHPLDHLMAGPEPPTAIVAVNDSSGADLLRAALRRGIRVPEELSITGFDDVPYAAHLRVPLTTVAQPFYEIGKTAVRLLQERIADPAAPVRKVLLPTTLKVRSSTAPPAT